MLKIFTGDDRIRATTAIKQYLGDDYEVIDCQDLTPGDLPSIFRGATFFATTRHLLLRDFLANSAVASELEKYLDTPHIVALLESKLDKRSAGYKAIKGHIEIQEYTATDPRQNLNLKFDIYRIAKRDGRAAVQKLRALEQDKSEDPIALVGLFASQALKDFAARPQGVKERKILQTLAITDLQMKTTNTNGWLLLESFLLRLSTL